MSAPESSVQLPHVVQRVVLVDEPSSFSSLCATTLITSPILVPQQHVHLIEPVKAGEMPAETDARAQLHDAQITADIMFEGLRRRRSSSYPGLPNQYYVGNMLPTLQEVEEMRARLHLHALMPKQPANFAIHVSTDVMMMVLDAHQLPQVEAAWLRVQQLANMVPPTQSPHLILLADDPCRRVLATHMKELVERLQNWNIIFVWAHAFAPPAIDYGLTESSVRSPCGLRNLMSSLCAGVATGIISDFPTARLDPAWLVPLDIAMNVGLMAMAAHLRGLPLSPHGGGLLSPPSRGTTTTTTSSSSPPHINMHAVSVALPPQQSVVWGMISDYIIDYYGRHVSEIRRAFPEPSLIAHRPNLTFQLRLADALRGGLDSTHVVPCVDGLLTRHRRQHLLSAFPNSTTTRLLSELADNLDASVRDVVASIHAANTSSNTPGMVGVLSTVLATQRKKRGGRGNTREASIEALFSFDLESYLYLLRKISTNMNVVSWMPSVCLSDVDWDMYARVVARSSLLHLSEHVLRCDRPLQLPLTTRAHTNDIIFHGEDRTPAHPSRWRRLFGSVDWMVRCATMENGQLRVIEPGLTPKRLVSILAQPDIQRIITTISVEEGIPKEEVARRAEKIVLRIGDTMNQWSIRASGFMVRQVFFKIFDRIHINRGAFEKLFRYFHIPRVQIVLIPLHRSYMDFLLITYLLVVMGIPSPHIVSGEDFLKLGTFAAMLRGCGAFFMRRSFRGDPLYAGLFKEYVRQLVHHRQPLEFFIEGARSRTGKTMVPKLGILKFVTDAFFEGQKEVDDVLIIPMSLSYDKLLEAQIYAKELLGIPKPPESVPNMIRAFRSLNQRYGYVNMNVGEPISLRSFKEQNTTTTTATTTTTTAVVAARPSASTSHTPTALLTALGWRIAHDLQTNIIVTPSAVVAALVECSIPYLHVDAPARGLSLSRLYGMVAWLRHIIIMRGGIFNDAVMSWEAERLTTVGLLHLDRFVCVDGESRVNYVAPVLISTIGANMSTNQLIHLFMDDAVVCAVAHAYGNRVWSAAPHNNNNNNRATSSSTDEDQRSTSSSSPAATVLQVKRDVLINTSQLLRRLLSREFPDYTAACPIPHDTWLESAVRRLHSGKEEQRVLHESSATTAAHVAIPTTQLYYFVLQLIFPHVESIFLAMLTLHTLFEEMPGSVVAAKSATTVAHKAGVAMLERNLLDHHISVCREVVQHAMEVLVDLRMVRLDRSGSSGLSYALAGGDGDEERTHAMSRIFVLMEQVNALRWHPLGNLREDAAEMKAFIRTHYLEVVHRSKV